MTVANLILPDWLVLADRLGAGAVDWWDEYLGLQGTPGEYTFCILRYQWLGPVPDDWYDDDGELLPKHLDENGDLRLPEKIDDCPVRAHLYGGFVGDLEPAWYDPVTIVELTEASVRDALRKISWYQSDFETVWQGIQAACAQAAPSV